MSLRIVRLSLILLQLFAGATPQQSKAVIEGVVVRAGTGDALPRAQVTLINTSQTGATPGPVLTDSLGRFIFRDVDPGSYRLAGARNGYVRQEYGQRVPLGRPGTVVTVRAGESLKDVAIRLMATGTVTGRITDPTGEPLVGIPVQVMRYSYNAGGERAFRTAGSGKTDDRGEYRIYWLTPGRYYVSAGNSGGSGVVPAGSAASPSEIYMTTYYPGTLDPSQASSIDVQPGAELNALDFFMTPQRPHRVAGRVIDSRTGRQAAAAGVSLSPRYPVGPTIISMSSSNYNAGTGIFEFRDIAPGQYWIRVAEMDPASGEISASARSTQIAVDVSTLDVDNIVAVLTPNVSIAGRVRIEGQPASSLTKIEPLTVSLRPSSNGQPVTSVSGPATSQPLKADGGFNINNVNAGEYVVTAGPLPPNFYIKEARIAGLDVLPRGMVLSGEVYGLMEIVLSPNGAGIEGTVVDEAQHPVASTPVVLVPDQLRDRRDLYKTTIADQEGHFVLDGIAPGPYKVFAWEEIEPFAYFDPDLLTRFEQQAKLVSVSESSRITLDVKAIGSSFQQ